MKTLIQTFPAVSRALICLFMSTLFATGNLAGQVEAWRARYNGPGDFSWELTAAVAGDPDGNVYVTGSSDGGGEFFDYATVKYDPNGVELWVARYDGPDNDNDEARGLAVDQNGNAYVTGSSVGGDPSLEDITTVKYDTDGNELWVARHNGPGNNRDHGYAITVDDIGDVYVTGRSHSGTGQDFATIKYDTDGNELWVSTYNGTGDEADLAFAIVVDDSGNVYITGESWGVTDSYDYATIKYDKEGDELWVTRYNGPADDRDNPADIAIDDCGNVYVTGRSQGVGTSGDFATIKYDRDGNELWVKRYNGPGNDGDQACAIAVGADQSVCVTGISHGGAGTIHDYATIKYDASGDEVWVRRLNGPDSMGDVPADVVLDSAGCVYVTGRSFGFDASNDYATIKYDPEGREMWMSRLDGPAGGADNAVAVMVDQNENVCVTGYSISDEGWYDYATVKYIPLDLTVSVTIDTTDYYAGDTLNFTVALTNGTDSTLAFEGWSEVRTPWGTTLSPLLGPIDVSLESGQTVSRDLSQLIPFNTPAGGPYTYGVRVGTFLQQILAADYFEFNVVPPLE